jgi:hypothetical protein
VKNIPSASSNPINLDDQLAQTDLKKLADAAGSRTMECGPFYSCFYNRFTGVADSGGPTEDLDATKTA